MSGFGLANETAGGSRRTSSTGGGDGCGGYGLGADIGRGGNSSSAAAPAAAAPRVSSGSAAGGGGFGLAADAAVAASAARVPSGGSSFGLAASAGPGRGAAVSPARAEGGAYRSSEKPSFTFDSGASGGASAGGAPPASKGVEGYGLGLEAASAGGVGSGVAATAAAGAQQRQQAASGGGGGYGLGAEAAAAGGVGGGAAAGGSPQQPQARGYGLDAETAVAGANTSTARPGATQQQQQARGFGLGAETAAAGGPHAGGFGLVAEGAGPSSPRAGPQQQQQGARDGGSFGLAAETATSGSPARQQQQQQQGASYGLTAETAASSPRFGGRPCMHDNGGGAEPYGLAAETGLSANAQAHAQARVGLSDAVYAASAPLAAQAAGFGLSSPAPLDLNDVSVGGRSYLLDKTSKMVYKMANGISGRVPEAVGKWVQGRVVFLPHASEADMHAALGGHLRKRGLALEDLFAAVDDDLDGALGEEQVAALLTEIQPSLSTSETALFVSLMDFDADGRIYLEDVELAGEECFEAAAEFKAGPGSELVPALQRVAAELHRDKHGAAALFSSLDSSGEKLLEPAQWVTFLRVLSPELTSKEVRYLLQHVYCAPGDNRLSLADFARALDELDRDFSDARTKGMAPARVGRLADAVEGVKKAQASSPRPRPVQGTSGANPRSAVSQFFVALQLHMRAHKVSLKEMLRRVDANSDGKVDSTDVRKLVRSILPRVTEAQMVYIRGAVNPAGLLQLPYDDLIAAYNKQLASQQRARGSDGGPQFADFLLLLAEHLHGARTSLDDLSCRFDTNKSGVLGAGELGRMLRYMQPGMLDKQVERCLATLAERSPSLAPGGTGGVAVTELRALLQARQKEIAAARAGWVRDAHMNPQPLMGPQASAAAGAVAAWSEAMGTTPYASGGMPQVLDGVALNTGDPRDPFTLASDVASGRTTHTSPGNRVGALVAQLANSRSVDISVDTILELQGVPLEPLIYIGHQYVLDPLSNLVFLPVAKSQPSTTSSTRAPAWGNSATDGGGGANGGRNVALTRLLRDHDLRLFGRLRPDRHVQRVETPATSALFVALDGALRQQRTTLAALVYQQARAPGGGSLTVPGSLAFPGLSCLLLFLLPSLTTPDLHYFAALFDLDGDGAVGADDIMDAFEEAGTTLAVLQTPAHKVHARAFKLLTRLSSVVLDDEVLMYRLYLEYDPSRTGALPLTQLSKFLCHVAKVHATQQHIGKWEATQHQVLPQHNVHADDVGAAVVYLHSASAAAAAAAAGASAAAVAVAVPNAMRNGPHAMQAAISAASASAAARTPVPRDAPWSLLLSVLRSLDVKFPGDDRSPGRRATVEAAAHLSPRDQLIAYGLPAELATQHATPPHHHNRRPPGPGGHSSSGGGHSGGGAPGMGPGTSSPAYGMAAEMAGTAGMPLADVSHHRSMGSVGDQEWGVAARPEPLRASHAGSSGGAGGARASVALQAFSLSSDPSRPYLLDPATGLLYVDPGDLSGIPGWPVSATPARPQSPGGFCLGREIAAAGGGVGPPRSYPLLVGRLIRPDLPLGPAPPPNLLHAAFSALSAAAADEYRLSTRFKLRDHNGRGLDAAALAQMLGEQHMHRGADAVGTAEAALVVAAVDADMDGRVTLADVQKAVAHGAQSAPDAPSVPITRGEEVALAALNAAAAALAPGRGSAAAAFWLAARSRSGPGGSLSPAAVSRVLRDALSALGPRDSAIAAAYGAAAAACLFPPTGVTPDELLCLMHALPMAAPTGTDGTAQFAPGFVHVTRGAQHGGGGAMGAAHAHPSQNYQQQQMQPQQQQQQRHQQAPQAAPPVYMQQQNQQQQQAGGIYGHPLSGGGAAHSTQVFSAVGGRAVASALVLPQNAYMPPPPGTQQTQEGMPQQHTYILPGGGQPHWMPGMTEAGQEAARQEALVHAMMQAQVGGPPSGRPQPSWAPQNRGYVPQAGHAPPHQALSPWVGGHPTHAQPPTGVQGAGLLGLPQQQQIPGSYHVGGAYMVPAQAPPPGMDAAWQPQQQRQQQHPYPQQQQLLLQQHQQMLQMQQPPGPPGLVSVYQPGQQPVAPWVQQQQQGGTPPWPQQAQQPHTVQSQIGRFPSVNQPLDYPPQLLSPQPPASPDKYPPMGTQAPSQARKTQQQPVGGQLQYGGTQHSPQQPPQHRQQPYGVDTQAPRAHPPGSRAAFGAEWLGGGTDTQAQQWPDRRGTGEVERRAHGPPSLAVGQPPQYGSPPPNQYGAPTNSLPASPAIAGGGGGSGGRRLGSGGGGGGGLIRPGSGGGGGGGTSGSGGAPDADGRRTGEPSPTNTYQRQGEPVGQLKYNTQQQPQQPPQQRQQPTEEFGIFAEARRSEEGRGPLGGTAMPPPTYTPAALGPVLDGARGGFSPSAYAPAAAGEYGHGSGAAANAPAAQQLNTQQQHHHHHPASPYTQQPSTQQQQQQPNQRQQPQPYTQPQQQQLPTSPYQRPEERVPTYGDSVSAISIPLQQQQQQQQRVGGVAGGSYEIPPSDGGGAPAGGYGLQADAARTGGGAHSSRLGVGSGGGGGGQPSYGLSAEAARPAAAASSAFGGFSSSSGGTAAATGAAGGAPARPASSLSVPPSYGLQAEAARPAAGAGSSSGLSAASRSTSPAPSAYGPQAATAGTAPVAKAGSGPGGLLLKPASRTPRFADDDDDNF
ncbi:hypothetical protein FOA52_010917 [Chlamydomonas sp. UWO 241]|nr:hypothetical protein FOA52_010917 [Chlamydomonas sp. UWO 241]